MEVTCFVVFSQQQKFCCCFVLYTKIKIKFEHPQLKIMNALDILCVFLQFIFQYSLLLPDF